MSGRARNNLKHGMRRPFCLGNVPKGAEWVSRQIRMMRQQLEQAVCDAKGEIDLTDAACIATCCRWERHALYAQRWLSKHHDEMSLDQKLNFSRDIARASESRDRAIRALGISSDARREKSLAALYADPIDVSDPEAQPEQDNAAQGGTDA